MQPNPPINRIEYLVKNFPPEVVLSTLIVLSDTVGIYDIRGLIPSTRPAWFDSRHDEAAWIVDSVIQRLRDFKHLKTRHDSDVLWAWIARELNRYDPESEEFDEIVEKLFRRGSAISEWQKATRTDISRMTWKEVLEDIERFDVTATLLHPGTVVAELSDGWTAVEVPVEGLVAEGHAMQNCLTGDDYIDSVKDNSVRIFSLRDEHGRPHVDIEYLVSSNRFADVLGKQNAEPAPKYKKYVKEFTDVIKPAPSYELTELEKNIVRESAIELAIQRFNEYDLNGRLTIEDKVPPEPLLDEDTDSAIRRLWGEESSYLPDIIPHIEEVLEDSYGYMWSKLMDDKVASLDDIANIIVEKSLDVDGNKLDSPWAWTEAKEMTANAVDLEYVYNRVLEIWW